MEGQQHPPYRLHIRDLPLGERPRERLRERGASYLSNADLIAILLRTGTASENALELANHLLSAFGGLGGLARASFEELATIHGVGEAKMAQLKAALELGRRFLATGGEERVAIGSPGDVANLVMGEMAFMEQECLKVLLLNSKNQVMAIADVYRANVSATTVRPAEVFSEAVRANHPFVVLVHNHPSGDPTPSPEDVAVTERLIQAGKVMDIEVLDHIIIGRSKYNGYLSMKELKLAFV
ncbi:MAG: DNA repair protein RadC [Chloroflexi bacterium]|nr:DNA repair protein RadC [Chloroflexota bacterium]